MRLSMWDKHVLPTSKKQNASFISTKYDVDDGNNLLHMKGAERKEIVSDYLLFITILLAQTFWPYKNNYTDNL